MARVNLPPAVTAPGFYLRCECIGEMFQTDCQAVCITTNQFVKQDGAAVMGRGCAKQAEMSWPGIGYMVGHVNRHLGKHTALLTRSETVGTTVLPTRMFGGQYNYLVPFHVLMVTVKPAYVTVNELCDNVVSWNAVDTPHS